MTRLEVLWRLEKSCDPPLGARGCAQEIWDSGVLGPCKNILRPAQQPVHQLVRLEQTLPGQPADHCLPNSEDESDDSTEPETQSAEQKVKGVIRRRQRLIAKSAASRRPGEVTFLEHATIKDATDRAYRNAV